MNNPTPADALENQILRHVHGPNYQPVKPRVIAKKLGVAPEQKNHVRRAIKSLVRQGRLDYGANHLVKPSGASPPAETLPIGVFQRVTGGFGFVRLPRVSDQPRRDDIFIPAAKTMDAANGDQVRLRLDEKDRRGKRPGEKRSGQIVEILQRGASQFVGLYREQDGQALVQIDGRVFTAAIPVGDPGAKNAQPGDKVVIELVRYPSPTSSGEGVITEVLGPRGQPGVDTLSIIREFELPDHFPQEVLEEARRCAAAFDETQLEEGRRDLTALTVVTIDPKDARDFDDAISLERLENGHWRLGVHIADVSHFVRPGGALDNEAKARGTSVYLPDRVIPMIPEIISNNLASLQPERVRFAKTVFLEMTGEGTPVATDFTSSAIRSARRFSYQEIDAFLADRPGWQEKLEPPVFQLLEWMDALAMQLRRRRLAAGAIELNLPEVKLKFDKRGEVSGAEVVEHTESHQIIEEFMLAANMAVARSLDDRQLTFLRRIHESPDPRKLQKLTEFVRELGYQCESLESRFEIIRILAAAAGQPAEKAVNYAVLRSMQKACYSPADEGHYALHAEHYCHFTSPIRRYPDLVIHRALQTLQVGRRPPSDSAYLATLGEHCSQREQRAEAAERELTRVKLLSFLSKRIGEKMDAVITGVEEFGLFVQGVRLPAEGLIPVRSLADDQYHFDSVARTLTGFKSGNQLRLGDLVNVQIEAVDLARRELEFRLLRAYHPRVATPGANGPKVGAARDAKYKGGQNKGGQNKGGQNKSGKSKSKGGKSKSGKSKSGKSTSQGGKVPGKSKGGKKKSKRRRDR